MHRVWISLLVATVVSLFLIGMGPNPVETPAKPLMMEVGALNERLGDPELLILDVRKESDWAGSSEKIAGALRADPGSVERWAAGYDRGKPIVLYCA